MPLFIKNSFMYKMICLFLLNPYADSKIKKIINKCLIYIKNSFLYTNNERYLNKNPYFLDSIGYKIIRAIIKAIDCIMDFFHNIFRRIFKGSHIISEFKAIRKVPLISKMRISVILICWFNVAYTLMSIILGENNIYIIVVLLILPSIMYISDINKAKRYFKGSLIYKIFRSW